MNGKHRDMEGEGKGDRHQHGQKPRIPAWNSPSEEVMEHWTPTGAEPMEQWMDGWIHMPSHFNFV